jgi:hypothetical protein
MNEIEVVLDLNQSRETRTRASLYQAERKQSSSSSVNTVRRFDGLDSQRYATDPLSIRQARAGQHCSAFSLSSANIGQSRGCEWQDAAPFNENATVPSPSACETRTARHSLPIVLLLLLFFRSWPADPHAIYKSSNQTSSKGLNRAWRLRNRSLRLQTYADHSSSSPTNKQRALKLYGRH